jgi:hypothetical protein
MSAATSLLRLLVAGAALTSWTHAARCGDTPNEAPSATAEGAATAPPPFKRVDLTEPALAYYQSLFAHHDVLAAPAFQIPGEPGKPVTLLFLRTPPVARGAFTVPALAAVQPDDGERSQVELAAYREGNLAEVEAFDVRDTDGDGRPEILLVARFEASAEGSVTSFRRAFQIARDDHGRLSKTLASWQLRKDTSITTIDALVTALAALRSQKRCPDLAPDMEEPTTIATVRCMVEKDQRSQLAGSVKYPFQVLLSTGVVRTLTAPAQLLEVYDDVVDRHLRDALREALTEPSYWGVRIGHAGLIVDEGKIDALFNADATAQRRMNEQLAGENRGLWRLRPSDTVCRTKRATHVFSYDQAMGTRRFQLTTWNDPKAVVAKRAPDRVLFGLMDSHGTCGNSNYTFPGPDGDVGFHYVACYGPGPSPEYYLSGPGGDEPCLDHPMLK